MERSRRNSSPERSRGRRAFTAEFKLEAVRLMRERRATGASVSQVGRELDVRPDMLRRWARETDARSAVSSGSRAIHPQDVFPGNGKLPGADDEIRRLKRELEVTRAERDFLKKAAAFFAKESR